MVEVLLYYSLFTYVVMVVWVFCLIFSGREEDKINWGNVILLTVSAPLFITFVIGDILVIFLEAGIYLVRKGYYKVVLKFMLSRISRNTQKDSGKAI